MGKSVVVSNDEAVECEVFIESEFLVGFLSLGLDGWGLK